MSWSSLNDIKKIMDNGLFRLSGDAADGTGRDPGPHRQDHDFITVLPSGRRWAAARGMWQIEYG
jgi:hypothetical protein